MSQDPEVPQDVCDLVEYNTSWRTELRLFVDEHNWPRVRPYVEAVKRKYPDVNFSLLGHTTEPRDGMRFGSTNADVELMVANIFNKNPQPKDPVYRPPGRPPGAPNVDYGVEQMTKVGDHVLYKFDPKNNPNMHVALSTLAGREGLKRRCKFRTVTVPEGVLVVLVCGEGLGYEHVVEV